MSQLWPIVLVCATACSFDSSGVSVTINIDADPSAPDAMLNDAGPPPPTTVLLVRTDPFGDGLPAAFLAGPYANRVYLGPSADGTRLFRCFLDGSPCISVSMSFPADAEHRNSGAAGIGFTGCTDVACGPDGESGRGILRSGVVAGTNFLILAGARSDDQNYIYMTSDTGTSADFLYVDLDSVLGGQTTGVSAAFAAFDRLYIGFPDTGGSQPYLIDLFAAPTISPGLDTVDGTDVLDLDATDFLKTGSPSMIDTMAEYIDRLYVANKSAWYSGVQTPQPYGAASGDWTIATPTASAYTNRESVATNKTADLFPSDRAVPSMAVYQGRLYAARNTTAGPQLWVCNPGGGVCNDVDWSLIAPDTSNAELTQFDNPNNVAITMLESTQTHLFVGFDNQADGVVVYRTDVAEPLAQADFRGENCTAGAGCPGYGGNGFGVASNQKFLDSDAVDVGNGVFAVWAITGNGVDPLSLYRLR